MGTRASAWLAWALAGLCVAMFLVSVLLHLLVRSSQEGPSTSGALGELLILVSFLAFPVVGALIASRQPKNPVGWICLAVGLFWILIFTGDSIPGSGPYPVTMDALTQAAWIPPRRATRRLPYPALPRRQAPFEEVASSGLALWGGDGVSKLGHHVLPRPSGGPSGVAQPLRAGGSAPLGV